MPSLRSDTPAGRNVDGSPLTTERTDRGTGWILYVEGEGSKPDCKHDWSGGTPEIRESAIHRQCLHCGRIEVRP